MKRCHRGFHEASGFPGVPAHCGGTLLCVSAVLCHRDVFRRPRGDDLYDSPGWICPRGGCRDFLLPLSQSLLSILAWLWLRGCASTLWSPALSSPPTAATRTQAGAQAGAQAGSSRIETSRVQTSFEQARPAYNPTGNAPFDRNDPTYDSSFDRNDPTHDSSFDGDDASHDAPSQFGFVQSYAEWDVPREWRSGRPEVETPVGNLS